MKFFKQGEPNLTPGKRVKNLEVLLDETIPQGFLSVSQEAVDLMKAKTDDIIYMADQKWYLGGLRSGHFRLASCHKGDFRQVKCSKATFKKAYLLLNRKVFIKKII